MQKQEDRDIRIVKTAKIWYNRGTICQLGLSRKESIMLWTLLAILLVILALFVDAIYATIIVVILLAYNAYRFIYTLVKVKNDPVEKISSFLVNGTAIVVCLILLL